MCGGSKGQSTSKQQSNTNSSYTPAGLGDLQNIFNRANQASQIPYVPYPGQLVAGFTPEQQMAQQNINYSPGIAFPFIGQSAGLFGESAQNPNFNGLTQSFYNPLASNVMANLNEVFGQQMANTTGQLQQAAGGVGADRIAVGQAELARQQGLAAGQTMAQLYGQAQQAAAGQQGLEQAAGFGFGQLGPAAEQALLSGSNAQLGVGTLGQQTEQNLLNAQYQQFLRQQGYPFQTAGFLGSVGLPAATSMGGSGTGQISGTTTYVPPQPNALAQGLGIGVGLLGMLAKGGRIKRDTGGLIPFNPNNETEFNINGYVPQNQPSQGGQSYNPMAMAPQMVGMGLSGSNSMVGGNPMTGSAGAYSQQNSPLTLAKTLRDDYKQGQADKGGLHDLVNKAAQNGWLDEDTAVGWGADNTVGGESPAEYNSDNAARGGRFGRGGSPWFGQALSSMEANAKTDPLSANNATTPEERLFADQIQQQLQNGSQNPLFGGFGGGRGMGDPWGSRLAMEMSPVGGELNDLAALEKQGLQPSNSQSGSSGSQKPGPAPFVPSQQSVDIGNVTGPTQSWMSPFGGFGGFGGGGSNNFSTFDPSAGGTLSTVPSWLQNMMGAPQAASNAGNGASVQPGVPTGNIQRPQPSTAMVARGGSIRGYDGGGGILDDILSYLGPSDSGGFLKNWGLQELGFPSAVLPESGASTAYRDTAPPIDASAEGWQHHRGSWNVARGYADLTNGSSPFTSNGTADVGAGVGSGATGALSMPRHITPRPRPHPKSDSAPDYEHAYLMGQYSGTPPQVARGGVPGYDNGGDVDESGLATDDEGQPLDPAARVNTILRNKGLSPFGAAAMTSRANVESGLNPTVRPGDGGEAKGLAQWHPDRWGAFRQWAAQNDLDPTSRDAQTLFMAQEGNTTEKDAWNQLKNAQTPEQGVAGAMAFERPRGYSSNNPEGVPSYQDTLAGTKRIAQGLDPVGLGAVGSDAGAYSGSRNPQTDAEMARWMRQMRENAEPITTPWGVKLTPGRQALMDFGFGMAASGSPWFGTAVGQGGLSAMTEMNQARQLQAQLNNMGLSQYMGLQRLGISEDELSLRQQEMNRNRYEYQSTPAGQAKIDKWGKEPTTITPWDKIGKTATDSATSATPSSDTSATEQTMFNPKGDLAFDQSRIALDPNVPPVAFTNPHAAAQAAQKERDSSDTMVQGAEQQKAVLAGMIRDGTPLQAEGKMGIGAEQLKGVAKSINGFARLFGMEPPINEKDEGNPEAIQKGTMQLTLAQANTNFGKQREAGFFLNQMRSLLPNIENSPEAFRQVTSMLLTAADYVSAFNQWKSSVTDRGYVPGNLEGQFLKAYPHSYWMRREQMYEKAQGYMVKAAQQGKDYSFVGKLLQENGIDPSSLGFTLGPYQGK